ncbi:MAG TPA: efflux RND transporter periplasmic adaptor subunit [Candidatus Eisenbacteria bacterium]|nr:efflux RND transporter periplasmic adaptor subunit [Candidatus Eisenbacteria bacterium]
MLIALLITVGFVAFVWLIFFRLKLLVWSITWAVVSVLVGVHVLLIFLIGVRFVAPYSTDAHVIQHTIQLTPRLPEPTLVTAVLVEPSVPVRAGQPLFQFDRRPYEYKVAQLEAEVAKAEQDVLVLEADEVVANQKVARAKSELEYAKYQRQLTAMLAKKGAGPEEEFQKWTAQMHVAEADAKEAAAEAQRARVRYQSQIGGVNTSVAMARAELDQARYYLDNTTMVAPEDGYVVNLQVRPGMVAGDVRFGAIASFICDADRYVLASYDQEVLKYVGPGQPVEVALDRHPGQIFPGRVEAIWPSGAGQLLPSGTLPKFTPPPPEMPQGRFAVRIRLDDPDQSKFPIGAQGATAIYTGGGGFAALRRIGIRSYTWLNFLYPIPF